MRQPLLNARAIIDPVWGGIFQYSDDGTWNSPHYEKIMSSQANAVRLYATAYTSLGNAEFRAAAEQVADYMLTRLKAPEGGFYPSQDADLSAEIKGKQFYALSDQERRKLGEPRIDRNLYAREAGWAISALVALHEATGEDKWLTAPMDACGSTSRNRPATSWCGSWRTRRAAALPWHRLRRAQPA